MELMDLKIENCTTLTLLFFLLQDGGIWMYPVLYSTQMIFIDF